MKSSFENKDAGDSPLAKSPACRQAGQIKAIRRVTQMGNLVRETPFSEVTATLEVLDRQGVTREHLAQIRSDQSYAKKVSEAMLGSVPAQSGSISHQVARAILGKNFFGVEEWATLYGVKFTKSQLRQVAKFPWGEEVLNSPCPLVKGKTVKETHFAFLGLENVNGKPLTILQLQELHPANGQPRFYRYAPDCWYAKETWATKTTPKFRWYLLPLEIVPNSESKNYQEQLAMLPQGYEAPTAVVEVLKELLYYRKNGIYLNPRRYGRTSDVTSGGGRVCVGDFVGGGLVVDGWGDGGWSGVGLGASRKF